MKDSRMRKDGLWSDSRGMASILVTLVTMIVVTLIVLGFAQISRREQGNTLDQQLSTQAFYAAESAVNDARNVINNLVQAGQTIPAKPNCNTDPGNNYPVPVPDPVTGITPSGVVLDSDSNVSYTCLIVNPTPTSLQKTGVEDNSWVVPVSQGDPAQPFDTIKIDWSPDPSASGTPSIDCQDPANIAAQNEFGPASGTDSNVWSCGYGVLRFDLVPTGGALDTASLLANQLTAFFVPTNTSSAGSAVNYGAATVGKANVKRATCVEGVYDHCSAYITGLTAGNYTLRINSIYKQSNISVSALNGGVAGNAVPISGQVLVDATGDADGVLRRIQVRISAYGDNGLEPRYALQSNSAICKRFYTTDGTPNGTGYFKNGTDIQNAQTDPTDQNYNAMCIPAGPDGTP